MATALVAALLLAACGRAEPDSPTPTLDEPIVLWLDGKHEEAVAALPKAPWENPAADFTLPLLTTSERAFRRLSASERETMSSEALTLTSEIRALARAAHAEYLELRDDEPERAAQLMQSLGHLAGRLRAPQRRLAIINLVGDAIQNIVDQHAIELEQLSAPSR